MATDSLDGLIRGLEEVADWARKELPKQAAKKSLDLVHGHFESGTDPRGRSWKEPLRGGGNPLRVTGGLRDSFTISVSGMAFTIRSSRFYAGIHNEGATIRGKNGGRLAFRINGQLARPKSVTIPVRPFTPDVDGDESSSPTWDDALAELVDKRLARVAS